MVFESLLLGELDDIRPLSSNVVRVFISSTFTDMVLERNYLMKNTYPKLRDYCQQHGLDFQVVDMRWGVTDDLTDDHLTTDICLKEIEHCQNISRGPNFIALIGDKYGYQPIPNIIESKEFEVLLADLAQSEEHGEEEQLLRKWYWEDENNVPPSYILQPITQHCPYFANMSDKNKQTESKEIWWREHNKMQAALRRTATNTFQNGLITCNEKEKYFTSVTEKEISKGILQGNSPHRHAVCFMRHLEGIKMVKCEQVKRNYLDVVSKDNCDIDSSVRVEELKQSKIPGKLTKDRISKFFLDYTSQLFEPNEKTHQEYLESLGTACYKHLRSMIEMLVADRAEANTTSINWILKEAHHHVSFCLAKCKLFFGRRDLVSETCKYLHATMHTKTVKPILTVYGQSGSGKTSLMAKIARDSRLILGENSVCIVRFLGTSPQSCDLWSMLKSICLQICDEFNIEEPKHDIIDDINHLVQLFRQLLFRVSEIDGKSLILVLDSLDQLSESYNAHSLHWLPKRIPINMFVIVSTLPDHGGILQVLQNSCPKDVSHFVEVDAISEDTAVDILSNWFRMAGRKVTTEQNDYLLQQFQKEPSPLYLRLAFDEACLWKSYQTIDKNQMAKTTRDIILSLFDKLEKSFGIALVSRSLGYITMARNGLSESELEDILSLDDVVLNQVYQYWDPPVEGVIRLPPLLWKRVRNALGYYLSEKGAGSTIVLGWYHRQFWEAAEERYCKTDAQIVSYCHVLSDYFLGTWSNGISKEIYMTQREKLFTSADRQVPCQPLLFCEGQFNLRKLSELPVALMKSKNENALMNEVLFSFDWILCKIKAMSVNEVIADYDLAHNLFKDEEVETVRHCLLLASDELIEHPNSLAAQLIARLCSYEEDNSVYPWMRRLLSGARNWLLQQDTPRFHPTNPCMVPPGGALQVTFRGHASRVHDICVTSDSTTMVSLASEKDSFSVHVWNLKQRECIHVFSLPGCKDQPRMCLSHDNSTIVAGNSNIAILNIESCEVVRLIPLPEGNHALAIQIVEGAQQCILGCVDGFVRCYKYSGALAWKCRPRDEPVLSALIHGNNELLSVVFCDGSITLLNLDGTIKNSIRDNCTMITLNRQIVMNSSLIFASGCLLEVWSLSNGSRKSTVDCHTGEILCLLESHNMIVTGSKDCKVKIWDSNFACVHVLVGHENAVWCLDASDERGILASGSKDDTVKLWCMEDWICLTSLVGHSSWVSCLSFCSRGNFILTGSNDKKVKYWKVERTTTDCEFPKVVKHEKHPRCIDMSIDREHVFSGSNRDALFVWKYGHKYPIHIVSCSVTCLLVGHDGCHVFIGSDDGFVYKYSLDGVKLGILKCSTKSIIALCHSTFESSLIAASEDGSIYAIESCALKLSAERSVSNDVITVMQFSETSDSAHIFVGGKDGALMTIEHSKHLLGESHELQGDGSTILCLALSRDGSMLACGTMDGTLLCWSLPSEKLLSAHRVSSDSVICLAFMRSSPLIIAGYHMSCDQLMTWDPLTKKKLLSFHGHCHAVVCVKVTEDDKHLISSSRDGTIKLWRINDGQLVDTIDFHSQIKHMSLTRMVDGERRLAATTMTGEIALLTIQFEKKDVQLENGSTFLETPLDNEGNKNTEFEVVVNENQSTFKKPQRKTNSHFCTLL